MQTLSDYISKNFSLEQLVLGATIAKKDSLISIIFDHKKVIAAVVATITAAEKSADSLDLLNGCYDWQTIFNSLIGPGKLNPFQVCVLRSGLLQLIVNIMLKTSSNHTHIQVKSESQLRDFNSVLLAVAIGHKFWTNHS